MFNFGWPLSAIYKWIDVTHIGIGEGVGIGIDIGICIGIRISIRV